MNLDSFRHFKWKRAMRAIHAYPDPEFQMKKIETSTRQKNSDRFGLKLFLAVLVATVAVFVWTSTHYQQHVDKKKDTWLDERGRLHVLGITLGASTLREAEVALQSRSDIALYIYPLGHPKAGQKLEAYFPAIADHTQVILRLDATPAQLHQIERRATLPHLYPNAVARSNLASEDYQLAYQLPVTELTLIPSTKLNTETLNARFGTPARVDHPEENKTLLYYPESGLVATLVEGEPAELHFSNPAVLP
jgi:hypothetical protein